MMTYPELPFQYQKEKNDSGLTGFAGLPLYIELATQTGFVQKIDELLTTKQQGWRDSEMILSLILLNLVGGDCITDMDRLEQDKGLRLLLQQFSTHGMKRAERRAHIKRWRKEKKRGLPSTAAVHRYLRVFHNPEEETKRIEGHALIPAANESLQALTQVNINLILAAHQQQPLTTATLDQDATLIETHKHNALFCYEGYKAYQPFNTYWAEQGVMLHSEFRDGNVPASFEQLRLLQTSLELLPKEIKKVYLRSDSAGYQSELLEYCAEGKNKRFGVIEFAISARVSSSFKLAVCELKESDWQPLYKPGPDNSQIKMGQEWAEVCFVPNWAGKSKQQATYRYIAIREKLRNKSSKSNDDSNDEACDTDTLTTNEESYKLYGLVTNRTLPGNEVINWYRERCGKSEQANGIQKTGLAGGQLPSNLFGVNAAWWHIMVLAFNLNRLMQLVALPVALKEKQMKGIRFHVIQFPGRVIRHARQLFLKVEGEAYKLFCDIRLAIAAMNSSVIEYNTS